MTTPHRPTRAAFRRAAGASVALHVAAAAAILLLNRTAPPEPAAKAIDTRATTVRMDLTDVAEPVEVAPVPPAPPAPPAAPSPQPAAPNPQPEAPPASTPPPAVEAASPAGPAGPFAVAPPRPLPPELVARVRQATAHTAGVPTSDPQVKPAGATAPGGLALHGAFTPGQTVVYLLDASGSMGAAGKFARARAALSATLAGQPETVRFQVLVYDWSAWPLAPGGTAPATPASVRAVAAQLAAVEPRGRSNHLVALRAALDLRPDAVVWLTDADDLTAAALKPVLKASGRPVPVFVGLVTPEGVQQPREPK